LHGVHDRSAYIHTLSALSDVGAHWRVYAFLASIGNHTGVGLASADLEGLASRGFRLLERRDSFDRRGRPSAWFLFEMVGHVR
jgi:hypothetical protein